MEDVMDYKESKIFKKWQETEVGRAANLDHAQVSILGLLLATESKNQIETLAQKYLHKRCKLSRSLLREVETLWTIMQGENEKAMVFNWLCNISTTGGLCRYYQQELQKGKPGIGLENRLNPVGKLITMEHGLSWGADILLNKVGIVHFELRLYSENVDDCLCADFCLSRYDLTEEIAFGLKKQMPENYRINWRGISNDAGLSFMYRVETLPKSMLTFSDERFPSLIHVSDDFETWLLVKLQLMGILVEQIIRGQHYAHIS